MDDIALVPVADAMRILGLGRTKFYELVGEQRIELVHIGKKALATKSSLTSFVASLPRGLVGGTQPKKAAV